MAPVRRYDRTSVIALVRDLVADLPAPAKSDRWENQTLEDFLQAFAAWLEDCDGYFHNLGSEVPDDAWEIVWHALNAAPSYE